MRQANFSYLLPNTQTIAVVLVGICAFINLYATQPLLPLLSELFQANKMLVSLTISASTFGVALAAPIIGRFADNIGRKRFIVTAALLMSVATFLTATSVSLNQLIFWRFIQGITTPAIFVIMVTYINEEWRMSSVGRMMAAYVSGTVIGGFSGRVIVALTESYLTWRGCFILLGVISLIGGLTIWLLLPKEENFVYQKHNIPYLKILYGHLCNRRLVAIYLVGFCVLFSILGTFNYLTFHLAATPFKLSTSQIGSIFFVYLVGALFTPMAGKWIESYGQRNTLSLAALIAISGLLLTLVSNLIVVILGLCIFCTGVFISQTSANSSIGKATQQHQALAVGLYVTFYYMGGSAGTMSLGWVWQFGGWWACVAAVIAIQITSLIIARKFWEF